MLFPLTKSSPLPEDDRFQKLAKDYIEGLLQAAPEYATELGDHRFDDKLTDYSDDAEAKELARAQSLSGRSSSNSAISTKLTGPNKVDVRLMRDNIDNEIFGIEELKEREWNPLVYNESLANSLYLLVARDFAPAEQRAASIRARMEKIPAVIAQAKANLKNPPQILHRNGDRAGPGAQSRWLKKDSTKSSTRRRKPRPTSLRCKRRQSRL